MQRNLLVIVTCSINIIACTYSEIHGIHVVHDFVSPFSRHTVRRSLVVESLVLEYTLPLTMGNFDYNFVALATETRVCQLMQFVVYQMSAILHLGCGSE